MIPRPDNLDEAQVARIHALLDSYAALKNGTLFLHESSLPCLSYAMWSWANERGHNISVQVQCGCSEATECWDVRVGSGTIYAFPNKYGQLAAGGDAVTAEIEKIKREAAARIKQLVAPEVSP